MGDVIQVDNVLLSPPTAPSSMSLDQLTAVGSANVVLDEGKVRRALRFGLEGELAARAKRKVLD